MIRWEIVSEVSPPPPPELVCSLVFFKVSGVSVFVLTGVVASTSVSTLVMDNGGRGLGIANIGEPATGVTAGELPYDAPLHAKCTSIIVTCY